MSKFTPEELEKTYSFAFVFLYKSIKKVKFIQTPRGSIVDVLFLFLVAIAYAAFTNLNLGSKFEQFMIIFSSLSFSALALRVAKNEK